MSAVEGSRRRGRPYDPAERARAQKRRHGRGVWAESRHASRAQTQLTCSVLDRFYCHREMARYNQPRGTIPGVGRHRPKRAEARAWVRESAAAEAARLNALVAE